jgi:hypothetical protein
MQSFYKIIRHDSKKLKKKALFLCVQNCAESFHIIQIKHNLINSICFEGCSKDSVWLKRFCLSNRLKLHFKIQVRIQTFKSFAKEKKN